MIGTIRKFFDNNIKQSESTDSNAVEHSLQLATAALLIEISRADVEVRDDERKTIVKAIRSKFGLSAAETEDLINLADEEIQNASSYHEFTSLINEHFPPEKKIKIVEYLWEVAYADSVLDKHENHIIRKISSLLYVPHKELINAKLRVRERIKGSVER